MITIEQAIDSLRPGTGWVLRGNDVAAIEWHTEGVEPLTQAEVEAEMLRLDEEQKARREATIAKLEALGLTLDDLAALTQ